MELSVPTGWSELVMTPPCRVMCCFLNWSVHVFGLSRMTASCFASHSSPKTMSKEELRFTTVNVWRMKYFLKRNGRLTVPKIGVVDSSAKVSVAGFLVLVIGALSRRQNDSLIKPSGAPVAPVSNKQVARLLPIVHGNSIDNPDCVKDAMDAFGGSYKTMAFHGKAGNLEPFF